MDSSPTSEEEATTEVSTSPIKPKEKLKQLLQVRRSARKKGNPKYSASQWNLTYSIFHITVKNAIETFGDAALKVMFDENAANG